MTEAFRTFRVAHLEDSDDDAEILRGNLFHILREEVLARHQISLILDRVSSTKGLEEYLQTNNPDLILSDSFMEGDKFAGPRFVMEQIAAKKGEFPPVIFVSKHDDYIYNGMKEILGKMPEEDRQVIVEHLTRYIQSGLLLGVLDKIYADLAFMNLFVARFKNRPVYVNGTGTTPHNNSRDIMVKLGIQAS